MAQDAPLPITGWALKRSGPAMTLTGDRDGGMVRLTVVKVELRTSGPVAIDNTGNVYALAWRR